jgi:hypothetical protein
MRPSLAATLPATAQVPAARSRRPGTADRAPCDEAAIRSCSASGTSTCTQPVPVSLTAVFVFPVSFIASPLLVPASAYPASHNKRRARERSLQRSREARPTKPSAPLFRPSPPVLRMRKKMAQRFASGSPDICDGPRGPLLHATGGRLVGAYILPTSVEGKRRQAARVVVGRQHGMALTGSAEVVLKRRALDRRRN